MNRTKTTDGFSIVELLIAVIIMGILASALTVGLLTRGRQARLAACLADLERIAEAERRVAIDLGYYVRLHVLDDVTGGDANHAGTGQADDIIDGIDDEEFNGIFQNQKQIFLSLDTQDLVAKTRADDLYDLLTDVPPRLPWLGPYLHIKRDDRVVVGQSGSNYAVRRLPDNPNDPWGADYLFFTSKGVVLEPDGSIEETLEYKDEEGQDQNADAKRFDRPTILSLGADGLPGGIEADDRIDRRFGQGDDLFLQFGY